MGYLQSGLGRKLTLFLDLYSFWTSVVLFLDLCRTLFGLLFYKMTNKGDVNLDNIRLQLRVNLSETSQYDDKKPSPPSHVTDLYYSPTSRVTFTDDIPRLTSNAFRNTPSESHLLRLKVHASKNPGRPFLSQKDTHHHFKILEWVYLDLHDVLGLHIL